MISFSLFGIPIRIHPWHWVTLALLGGITHIKAPSDVIYPLMFMIAGFIAILAHELGHALVGNKMGYKGAEIDLIAFGGVTRPYGAQLSRPRQALTIAAGPAVNIGLGIICFCICLRLVQPILDHGGTSLSELFLSCAFLPEETAKAITVINTSIPLNIALIFSYLIFTSIWWSMLNLLPMLPLDGGGILMQLIKNHKVVFFVGIITAIAISMLAFHMEAWMLLVFMLFLGYQNFRAFKESI